ncbi:MAG: preprotein translocase subunit YajC [Alicyclobacillaceae bacterium]|nr:preprotein translocase subunit YajC [Alicyclobacillaceae bacterium]
MQGGSIGNIILIIAMLAVFYFLLIVPQRRQQKQRSAMMQQLGPGAKILTTSGIYGQVVTVQNDVLRVRIAPKVEVEMDNRAVLRVVEPAPGGGSDAAAPAGGEASTPNGHEQ